MPCQTQMITLLSTLSSNHHHYQHYVCYEYEMYHLCQYEYDIASANCKHKNIYILADCCTIVYIHSVQKKGQTISIAIIQQRPVSYS